MDTFGICLLGLGGAASATYYAFRCNPKVQRVYLAINLCSTSSGAVKLLDAGGGGSKCAPYGAECLPC